MLFNVSRNSDGNLCLSKNANVFGESWMWWYFCAPHDERRLGSFISVFFIPCLTVSMLPLSSLDRLTGHKFLMAFVFLVARIYSRERFELWTSFFAHWLYNRGINRWSSLSVIVLSTVLPRNEFITMQFPGVVRICRCLFVYCYFSPTFFVATVSAAFVFCWSDVALKSHGRRTSEINFPTGLCIDALSDWFRYELLLGMIFLLHVPSNNLLVYYYYPLPHG